MQPSSPKTSYYNHLVNPVKSSSEKPKPTSVKPKPTPKSVPENYDVCQHADCSHPKDRPLLDNGATVYVVFGVKGFHWSSKDIEHVMSDDSVSLFCRFV